MAKHGIVYKKRTTLEEAIQSIPHDECYCNDSGRCPYFRLYKYSKGRIIKNCKKRGIIGLPINYSESHLMEYCTFLKAFLWVQDGVKDCGINEDITQGQADEWNTTIDSEKDKVQPFQKRINCIEMAKMYKEMFPGEKKFIDQIIKEDKLEKEE